MRGKEVFLSHSEKNCEASKKIGEQLKSRYGTLSFFSKKDILVGDNLPAKITSAIDNCKVFVVELNKDSSQSSYVQHEIAYAKRKNKRIIPVLTEACEMPGTLEWLVMDLLYIDANPPDDGHISEAVDKIEKAASEGRQSEEFPQAPEPAPKNRAPFPWRRFFQVTLGALIVIAIVAVIAVIAAFGPGWATGVANFFGKVTPKYDINPENGEMSLTFPYRAKMRDFSKDNRPPWYQERNNITSVIIPKNATRIGNLAFEDCPNLEAVTILGEIESIGNSAFHNCPKLERLDNPDNAVQEGFGVVIPESVTIIGNGAFSGCESLKSVYIPDSVVKIQQFAFHSCGNMDKVRMSEKVTFIGKATFEGCKKLKEIEIPSLITSIPGSLFANCQNLTEFKIHETVTEIGDSAFQGAGLKKIKIPSSVTKIGEKAFKSCEKLPEIDIPNSVTEIGNEAFMGCSALDKINLPQTFLKNVGADAFPYDKAKFTFKPAKDETETSSETANEAGTPQEPVAETEVSSALAA